MTAKAINSIYLIGCFIGFLLGREYSQQQSKELWLVTMVSTDGKTQRQWETQNPIRWGRTVDFCDFKTGKPIQLSGNVIVERSQ
jgi:hypothetical protein